MPHTQYSRDGIGALACGASPGLSDLVSVSPRRFLTMALVIIAFLAVMSAIAGVIFYTADDPRFRTEVFYKIFWLDYERNLPSFFNFSLIMLSAFLLIALARLQFLTRGRWRFHLAAMAAIFFFLAFDEAAQFHEANMGFVRYLVGASGIFYFAWIIPAMAFLAVFVLAYLGFLRALPIRVSATMVMGGVLYVGGAIGMEMIGGTLAEAGKTEGLAYGLSVNIEEILEMTGLSVFITALLSLLNGLEDASFARFFSST